MYLENNIFYVNMYSYINMFIGSHNENNIRSYTEINEYPLQYDCKY